MFVYFPQLLRLQAASQTVNQPFIVHNETICRDCGLLSSHAVAVTPFLLVGLFRVCAEAAVFVQLTAFELTESALGNERAFAGFVTGMAETPAVLPVYNNAVIL